jgi:hypothetical protein
VGQTLLFSRWRIRKHLLDDLYIRFFRLADIRIGEKARFGVVSFISNSSYLAGRSHPIMRESLLEHFDKVWIDNLHGNRIASERTPDGQSCETIFNTEGVGPGIKVGTAVSTFVKRGSATNGTAKVFVRDFWGRAAKKRAALLSSLEMDSWSPDELRSASEKSEGPRSYQELHPTQAAGWKFTSVCHGGFDDWPSLDDLFPRSFQGVNPNRGLNGTVIDVDAASLKARMQDYFSDMEFDELRTLHPNFCKPRARCKPKITRKKLLEAEHFEEKKVLRYVAFPLDTRWIYYETKAKLLNEPRQELGKHLDENEFLVGTPQARRVSESRPLLVRGLFDLHLHDWGSVGFPAEVNPEQDGGLFRAAETLKKSANLAAAAWLNLKTAWKLGGDVQGVEAKGVCRSLFRYCIAISHAPQYESDHKDQLAQGWPHIPLTKEAALFKKTAALGEQVSQLLDPLAEPGTILKALLGKAAKKLAVVESKNGGSFDEAALKVKYSYYGPAMGRWEERPPQDTETLHPEWGEVTGNLYLNKEVFLSHVPNTTVL